MGHRRGQVSKSAEVRTALGGQKIDVVAGGMRSGARPGSQGNSPRRSQAR